MTDSEKLDLLLEKLVSIENEVTNIKNEMSGLKTDVNGIKRQVIKSTAELKAMDEIILDEVERVHSILDKHKLDKAVHTA